MNKNRTITIKSKSGITYKIDKVTKRIKVKKIKKLKDKKNINPFERKNRRNFKDSGRIEGTSKIDSRFDKMK